MYLSQIHIYPLKSAGGISVEHAAIDGRGFKYDRRWMLVDATGRFLSQRELPRMSLIRTQLLPDCLVVGAPGRQDLEVPLSPGNGEPMPVAIWRDVVPAVPLGEEVHHWFQDFLRVDCRLVFMPEETVRQVDLRFARPGDRVAFADGYPFLLLSEASLEDLNNRLDQPVPMNSFRPNLVVSGCEPFAEDRWRRIRIGAITFMLPKPCARCAIVTVDQARGVRGKEPLRTLAGYRESDGKVYMGQNLIHEAMGALRVGEEVEVLE